MQVQPNIVLFRQPRVLLTPEERRNKIFGLEQTMFDMPEYHVDLPVTHYFTPGLYCRQIYMPAGVTLTSKIHKTEHVYIISQGKVAVTTDEESVILSAPHTGITKPGTKRALHIIEDTIWTTMHPTVLTDLEAIENVLIAPSYEAYLLFADEQKVLEKQ